MADTLGTKKISPDKLMGTSSPAVGNVGLGDESKIGKLSRILRTTRVKVNKNEKDILVNTKDISINVDKLMGLEDEQEQIHETIFGQTEKLGETRAQVKELVEDKEKEKEKKGSVTSEGIESLSEGLNTIAKELTSINTLLGVQLKSQEKAAKEGAAAARAEERRRGEEEREGKKEKTRGKGLDIKTPKPVVDFFDKIKSFFTQILLGSAVLGIIKWFRKDENKKKFNEVVDFIADNVPIILAGLASIVGLGIGPKLIGFLGTLTGLVTGLVGLLGPAGLLGVITAAAAILGAWALDKFVKPMLQDAVGGVGYTSTGLVFGLEDVNDLRNDFNKFANDSGMSYEQKKPRLDMFRDLEATMRENKSITDTIVRTKNKIKFLEEKIAQGNTENQPLLDRRRKDLEKLENDQRFSNAQVTRKWQALQISESDLEKTIRSNDRRAIRTPGAVAPELRKEYQKPKSEEEQKTAAMVARAMLGGKVPESIEQGFAQKEFMIDKLPESKTPDFTSGMMDHKFDPMHTQGQKNLMKVPLQLDTKKMFASQMVIDIPPPTPKDGINFVDLSEGAVGERAQGEGTSLTAGQAPAFSAFDPNNSTVGAIMSIYNSL